MAVDSLSLLRNRYRNIFLWSMHFESRLPMVYLGGIGGMKDPGHRITRALRREINSEKRLNTSNGPFVSLPLIP